MHARHLTPTPASLVVLGALYDLSAGRPGPEFSYGQIARHLGHASRASVVTQVQRLALGGLAVHQAGARCTISITPNGALVVRALRSAGVLPGCSPAPGARG